MLEIKTEVFKIFIHLKTIIKALHANINYIFMKNNYFLKQKLAGYKNDIVSHFVKHLHFQKEILIRIEEWHCFTINV